MKLKKKIEAELKPKTNKDFVKRIDFNIMILTLSKK